MENHQTSSPLCYSSFLFRWTMRTAETAMDAMTANSANRTLSGDI
jgi:hypothetical protein